MLYRLKGPFQKISEKFLTSGMTAHQASGWGVIFIILICCVFYIPTSVPEYSWLSGLAPLFIFLRLIMNALDGLLARRLNTASPAGEVFNELSDVIGDSLCYGFLGFAFPELFKSLIFVIVGIWFCEFVAVLGKSLPHGVRRQDSLAGGKPERAVYLGLISILMALSVDQLERKVEVILILVGILVFMTGVYRVIKALKGSKGAHYESKTLYGR
jgi:CDP-diacylglycerol--glycerol-3-phosphate 3-phosphatidyltransferase